MLDATNIENLTPYFWVYSPVREIKFKKPKDRCLKKLSDVFQQNVGPYYFKKFNKTPEDQLHCTIMEQPRTLEKQGKFRWQPLSKGQDIKDTVAIVGSFVTDVEPLKMSGHGLEIIQRRNRGLLVMNMNAEAISRFESLYMPMMEALGHIQFYDLYKEVREPKIVLARSQKMDNRDIKDIRKSVAKDFGKMRTKSFTLDQFVLGQGFFDVHGRCIAKRDVATIHARGGIDWHCQNAFEPHANRTLLGNHLRAA